METKPKVLYRKGDACLESKGRQKNANSARFVIVGTGFSGLAAAVRLRQEGERDIIILEREGDVGGVWRDNRYPGCACDVESHLYSFSFAPNPNWSRVFSPQPEIYTYLQNCAKEFGLMEHIRFHHEVKRMEWNEQKGEWSIGTSKGDFTSQFVVGAFGALSNPSIPKLEGLQQFKGEVFHSAAWPENYNPAGKRIAVVGTGASAIQFIPAIQPDAEHLHVFQRTPPWVVPRLDGPISTEEQQKLKKSSLHQKVTRLKIYAQREVRVLAFRNPKWMKTMESIARHHLHKAIKDPELREKLTPDYRIGCKRILLSNNYFPALAQPNVEVNTSGLAKVTENAVRDSAGREIPVDTIIFGTGFQVSEMPFSENIYGRKGHTLKEEWNGSPQAYMGTTVSGFPNLFILQGPNTGLGHSSVIIMIEAQVEHIMKALKHINRQNLKTIEPSAEAQERFIRETDQLMEGTVWTSGGCKSWYLDQTGRNSTLWPGYTFSFLKKASKLKRSDYIGRREGKPKPAANHGVTLSK
ncbi:NAD(P)/FAD-dependent oxidoreductase [Rossellomorea vietnamensis]|uniref:NAD(P)/FAD-dependent oxidoreductase n=1 Tax=Rossellomorea vietnamensis TaxID=218284 RepID=A0A5D4NW84_9BACI|nr:NAD(P)/FAD-dependent oxidoreductase [Rossellomorea vietnamensis]